MFYVYILRDKTNSKHYIGSCVDLDKRISRHRNHTGGYTTQKGEWELLCFVKVETLIQARILEKKIKSYKGGNAFRKIINGELDEWIFVGKRI